MENRRFSNPVLNQNAVISKIAVQIDVVYVLRRQSSDTNRNMKRLVFMPIRIVKSNVSSLGPSSERNRTN